MQIESRQRSLPTFYPDLAEGKPCGFQKSGQSDRRNCRRSQLKNTETLLVTGIANPTPLVEYLTNQKIKFKHLKYPDHYQFKEKDIAEINSEFKLLKSNNNIVLTTEKDYVRIFADLQNLRYICQLHLYALKL